MACAPPTLYTRVAPTKRSREADRRVDLALFVGRGAENNFLATSDLCRYRQHEQGRKQRCRAAGNVEPDLLDGHAFAPATHPRHGVDRLRRLLLRRMKLPNVGGCKLNGGFQFLGNRVSSFQFGGGDQQLLRSKPSNFSVSARRPASPSAAHLREDGLDLRFQLRSRLGRPFQQPSPFGLGWI